MTPGKKATRKQLAYLDLKPSDVDGRYAVVVQITPHLQDQARLSRAQLAQAYRAPGPNGLPLMDDLTILEDVMEQEHPAEIGQRIAQQYLPARSQEVLKLQTAAEEQDWIDENPDIVKQAEKRLNPEGLSPLDNDKAAMMMQILQKAMTDPMAMQQLMASMGMADNANGMMPGAPQGPAGGPMPQVMPAQMQMTPEQALPQAATLPAKQARRGKAQHK